MRKLIVGLSGCLVLVLFIYLFNNSKKAPVSQAEPLAVNISASIPTPAPEPKEPTLLFGIPTDSLVVINETIKSGQSLSHILQDYNINQEQLNLLRQKSKKVFNLREIQANKPYTLLCENDSAQTARYFIYQPSHKEYVVIDLQDSLNIYKTEKDIEVVERTVAGTITSSLYMAMVEAGCSPSLINHFADIFSWKINFSAIQPGDEFKLVYEEHLIDGEVVDYGEVKAAFFAHSGKPHYAIRYNQGNGSGYYDEHGKSLKKAFLKEPLEYSRISSRFSASRFHPVQKRFKAHLGTDFAAPYGTPIRSVGEGVVVAAGFTAGNGNYVKIKHDDVYTTQYLHMSKFAKGIKKGTKVTMGQTIGYVGSTGLATGPHLCYRFWKNGKQVDALKQKLPVAKSIDKQHKEAFEQLKNEVLTHLEKFDGTQPTLAKEKAPHTSIES